MIRRTLILVMLIMLVASVAEAQRATRRFGWQRSDRWDLSLSTRFTTGKTYDGEGGSSVKLQEDLGWGFGFGYNFDQHFNLGLMFSWRSVPYEAKVIDASTGEVNTYNNRLTTSNFGLSGEYNILQGRFTPYVNGGLGWIHLDTNIFAGWAEGCYWYPYWGYYCGPVALTYGANAASYGLGAGGRFEMTEGFFIRVGYERGWTSNDTFDGADMFRLDIGLLM